MLNESKFEQIMDKVSIANVFLFRQSVPTCDSSALFMLLGASIGDSSTVTDSSLAKLHELQRVFGTFRKLIACNAFFLKHYIYLPKLLYIL
jgi:hypothetical protein